MIFLNFMAEELTFNQERKMKLKGIVTNGNFQPGLQAKRE